jgi:Rrf2 family protein
MFSQTVDYALRAMVFLAAARDEECASSERIAEQTQVSPGYLSKVMRDLVLARLVVSQRGPRGGFSLALPPGQISILDIVDAVDPIRRIEKCPLGNPAHAKLCPLHERLDRTVCDVRRTLSQTTLADIPVETPLPLPVTAPEPNDRGRRCEGTQPNPGNGV